MMVTVMTLFVLYFSFVYKDDIDRRAWLFLRKCVVSWIAHTLFFQAYGHVICIGAISLFYFSFGKMRICFCLKRGIIKSFSSFFSSSLTLSVQKRHRPRLLKKHLFIEMDSFLSFSIFFFL